jgi:hypothetical protein
MDEHTMIRIDHFCMVYDVEPAFIHTLGEWGMVDIVGEDFISTGDLDRLDKLMRLHRDLDLDASGIEAVEYLLQKISAMQKEILHLKNRLKIYE